MKKLKPKLEWDEKNQLLTFTDKIVLNEDDLFKNYTTWVKKHGEIIIQIRTLLKELDELEDRIILMKPYYDKIKDRVLTKMALYRNKKGVG